MAGRWPATPFPWRLLGAHQSPCPWSRLGCLSDLWTLDYDERCSKYPFWLVYVGVMIHTQRYGNYSDKLLKYITFKYHGSLSANQLNGKSQRFWTTHKWIEEVRRGDVVCCFCWCYFAMLVTWLLENLQNHWSKTREVQCRFHDPWIMSAGFKHM